MTSADRASLALSAVVVVVAGFAVGAAGSVVDLAGIDAVLAGTDAVADEAGGAADKSAGVVVDGMVVDVVEYFLPLYVSVMVEYAVFL
jgi:hypothetical protein